MYEYRTNNNPKALPLGDSTISRHRTLDAAHAAWDAEWRRHRMAVGNRDTWLMRLIAHDDHLLGRCYTCRAAVEDRADDID